MYWHPDLKYRGNNLAALRKLASADKLESEIRVLAPDAFIRKNHCPKNDTGQAV
jgi:hypothetical protein